MKLWSLFLALPSLALAADTTLAERQSDSVQCTAITANIDPLSSSCAVSTTDCLQESSQGFGTIPAIQSLICPPTSGRRENVYDVLVGCTSQEYADLVYSALCGKTAVNGTSFDCTDAILQLNDGKAAKLACCSSEGGSSGYGSGSVCASELRKLSRDLGCCTATVVMQFFFAETAGCPVEGGLDQLLEENGVDRPDICDFPLYEEGDGAPGSGSAWLLPLLTLVACVLISV